jgi:hypothetical protein
MDLLASPPFCNGKLYQEYHLETPKMFQSSNALYPLYPVFRETFMFHDIQNDLVFNFVKGFLKIQLQDNQFFL